MRVHIITTRPDEYSTECPHCGVDFVENGVVCVSLLYQTYDIIEGSYDSGDVGETLRHICGDCGEEIPYAMIDAAERTARQERAA